MVGMANRRWRRWRQGLGLLSSLMGGMAILLSGNNASAATYGAYTTPGQTSNMMLTWVLFDQPQGEIWGYACDVPSYSVSNAAGIPTLSPSNSDRMTATALDGGRLSGYYFGVVRYAIVWDGTRLRTTGRHSATFAVWNEYRGQSNYHWRMVVSNGATSETFLEHNANINWQTGQVELTSNINPQTGWFDNNTPISPLGRACVNGGISAATEVIERELGVRFVQHEETPI